MARKTPEEQAGSGPRWWLIEGSEICSICEAAVQPEILEFCAACDQGICPLCLGEVESTGSVSYPACGGEYQQESGKGND